ncbi:MAG: hypothetical protein ABSC51_03015 [Gaiellaceae bacterium]|jgi:hypothetical protein
MRATGSKEGIRELLEIEEADAWFEYLRVTREVPQSHYAEVERWAWARLRGRLHAIRARRAELVPVA